MSEQDKSNKHPTSDTDNAELIEVSVAYALPDQQTVIDLRVPEHTSILSAIKLSKIADDFPEIDIEAAPVGIFGQLVSAQDKASTTINAGDRIEIYRPLLQPPGQSRVRRAKQERE